MLQTISKHIQGWFAGVVIALITAAFLFWGLESYISSGGEQQSTVATVNGVKITANQLNAAYQSLQRSYTQSGTVLNEQAQQQLRYMALQQLILDRVLLQAAHKSGLNVSPEQAQQAIMSLPEFQENGQFSPQRFQQLLANNHLNPTGFVQRMQSSLLLQQLSVGLTKSSFILPDELKKMYALFMQKRSFGYFILPGASFIKQAQPSDKQISNYYEEHKAQFQTPAQTKVDYLLLSPDKLRTQVTVTPTEVKQFYEENISQYTGKSFADAKDSIYQRLQQQHLNQLLSAKSEQLADLTYTDPSSLETAAAQLSLSIQQSPWLSEKGIKGDALWSDPTILRAVFSNDVFKQGNNSELIELKEGGFLVLRVAEHQASQAQLLADVREKIVTVLQKEQGQKQAGLQAYQIQHALESGKQIADLAKQYGLKWQGKKELTRQDKTVLPDILTAAFKLVPSDQPNRKVATSVLLSDGDYAIVALNSFHNADYKNASTEEREKLHHELMSRWGQLDYQLFMKSALNAAKVDMGGQDGN